MDSLFEIGDSFDELLGQLRRRLEELSAELRLPRRGLVVKDNNGKVARTWSVCVNEPPHPLPRWEVGKSTYALTPLYNLSAAKGHGRGAEVLVKCARSIFAAVDAPIGAGEIIEARGQCERTIPLDATGLLDYLAGLAAEGVARFKSSAESFGCCSLFEQCSDAGQCLHENLLYSTACAYRRNLEAGRVFYGRKGARNAK